MPRLTRIDRDRFIEAVGAKLPPLPYSTAREAFRTIAAEATEEVEKRLPGAALEYRRRFPELFHRGQSESFRADEGYRGVLVSAGADGCWGRFNYAQTVERPADWDDHVKAARAAATEKINRYAEALDKRAKLLGRLREVANACGTDAALKQALPEFAELIPEPTKPTKKQLPVAASQLVADFVKAGMQL